MLVGAAAAVGSVVDGVVVGAGVLSQDTATTATITAAIMADARIMKIRRREKTALRRATFGVLLSSSVGSTDLQPVPERGAAGLLGG